MAVLSYGYALPPMPAPARSCCMLSSEAYDVWLAWTIAGALGFALSLACTARLWQPCCRRRRRKQVRLHAVMGDGHAVRTVP